MKTLRHTDAGYARKLDRLCAASSLFDAKIEVRARAIVERVAAKGDAALIAFTKKFDGATLTAKTLRVNDAELAAASKSVTGKLRAAIRLAHRNIIQFHKRGLRKGWSDRNAQGARVAEKYDPFGRVGIYIPGGTAPLMSTALMTVTLAKVAGCKEIVVCTPCRRDGKVNSGLLHAAKLAGATEIISRGWSTRHRGHGARHEIGCAGAENIWPRQCVRGGCQAFAGGACVHRSIAGTERSFGAGGWHG